MKCKVLVLFSLTIALSAFGKDEGGSAAGSTTSSATKVMKIAEGRLVLETLGEATSLIYNERPAFVLKLNKDQISSGAANREILVKYVMASYNPIPALDPCKY